MATSVYLYRCIRARYGGCFCAQPYVLAPGADSIVATVSIGISVAESADRTPSDLYREADLALYRAKDAGRDQYALFDDALRAKAVARLESEGLLRRAVTEDLLVPLYQPIIDLTTAGSSAWRCWPGSRTPTGDSSSPRTSSTSPRRPGSSSRSTPGCSSSRSGQFARWSATEGVSLRRMSVNVSARSLEDPSLRRPAAPGTCVVRRGGFLDPDRAHRAQPADDQPCCSRLVAPHHRPRHGRGPGRLRHRLLRAGLPPAVPPAVPEDRPVLREPAGPERARRRGRGGGHRPGPRP